MLRIYSEYFSILLSGEASTEEIEPEMPIPDGGVEFSPPDYDYDEVCLAFKLQKNNEVPGSDSILLFFTSVKHF